MLFAVYRGWYVVAMSLLASLCSAGQIEGGGNERDEAFFSNAIIGVAFQGSYSPNNDFKAFRGQNLSLLFLKNETLHEFTLRMSESRVEVISPVRESSAQRIWDVEYAWEHMSDRRKVRGTYWSPLVGVRYKENLSVTCPYQDTYCFNDFVSSLNSDYKSSETSYLLGLRSGLRFPIYKIWLKGELQITTDEDSQYVGGSISLLYGSFSR